MRAVEEGLEVSGPPCARVLSVAGFLAKRDPFLSGKRFILRVKKASFCLRNPLFFNPAAKSVIEAVPYTPYIPGWWVGVHTQGGVPPYLRVYRRGIYRVVHLPTIPRRALCASLALSSQSRFTVGL